MKIIAWLVLIALVPSASAQTLETDAASFTLDQTGSFSEIVVDGRNLLAPRQPAPLLQVRVAGRWIKPASAQWDGASHSITLHFDPSVSARIKAVARPTHLTFEVLDVEPKEKIEEVLWGPYPTTIGQTIGEIVGVVRDQQVAVGIQALNPKTLGGAPAGEDDVDQGSTHDDRTPYPDLARELNKDSSYRGSVAAATEFGSVLQAFCRNRDRDRIISNWGHEHFLSPAFDDGGVVGSKIALFACHTPDALATIGRIEVAEGLPHPLLAGTWAKVSPRANASYLIVDFGESNIDQAIEQARRAGLHYLYHSSPFATWGHFVLNPKLFPHGKDGLRVCVDKAKRAGVRVGFHTLSNFITPDDAYVTPRPDPRLARVGSSPLPADVDAQATEIAVASPEPFQKHTDMNTVVIGEELIQYASVSRSAPWRLLGCHRGAWKTQAAEHHKGDPVGKLVDHGYKVFLGNADLSRECAVNIARLCNDAGICQISMDGLEGNWSTGYGQYGRVLFASAWYNALTPEAGESVRSDASNPSHYNWHINTYYNWGEPWYDDFRKSQTRYRFKNQPLFTRNYLPRMLGWFSLRPKTSLADIEWLLARSAGYNAGFALAVSMDSTAQRNAGTLSHNPDTDAILAAVSQWESARLAGAFPLELRRELQDNTREFHLEPAGPGKWDLYPMVDGKRGMAIRVQGKPAPK